MSSLNGQVVLVTGAARGIGAETSKLLVRKGARVVLVDRDEAPLREVADQLGDANALAFSADVTELASMEEAVEAGLDRFGRLDVVLANAGIASYGSVLAVDPEMFKRVIDVNINGVFNTVRAALPHVIEQRGYVLIVASAASFAAAAGMAPYDATKAGVEHFASALRIELGYRGVAVGSAHMSWIDTPLVQDAKQDLSAFQQMVEGLPGPLGKTTSVDACAKAFVQGIEQRKAHVYVPRWVGVLRWLKPVLTSPFGERLAAQDVPTVLPQMDEEVARLGRSTSARNVSDGADEESRAPSATTAS
ncbi:MAG TPA: SDR family oxidoreductase [Thermoleophilaceae bacterium]|jgi:NAD(P)-dependent dehydrogenase (short-subunit alcohol dehydrogenase family)